MLVFAVAATLVPALALTVVSSRKSQGSIGDQIAQEQRGTSTEAAWEIDQWLGDRLRDLRVAATAYAVAENLVRAQAKAEAVGRLREYLNSVRERCSDCEALLVVEGHGRFVASSGGRMTGVQFSPDRLSSLRTSDALVGDPYWDTGLGKAAIGLAVPIRQPDGRYVGALMAKLNLRAVADLLQRLAPRAAAGGDLYVMTDQGRLILKSRVSSADLMRTKLPMAQELLDREGSTVEYRRADGQNVIGTLRRVPALRWAAVVDMPRAEAFRQAGGGGGAGLALVVLLVVAGLASYVGLLLVRPLRRLSSVAAKVAAGDHSVELPTGGGEVLVMLIEAPIATAAAVGERLRARVAAEEFSGGRVTVSVGAAEYPTHGETPEELIASADAAMYQAKGEGRDRVVVAGRRAEREQEGKRRRKGEG